MISFKISRLKGNLIAKRDHKILLWTDRFEKRGLIRAYHSRVVHITLRSCALNIIGGGLLDSLTCISSLPAHSVCGVVWRALHALLVDPLTRKSCATCVLKCLTSLPTSKKRDLLRTTPFACCQLLLATVLWDKTDLESFGLVPNSTKSSVVT